MAGEFELIARLRERIASAGAGRSSRLRRGSGDDAAITEHAGAAATSVDAVVDGVHFQRSTFPPPAIGSKAAAAALSDLAAMGAEAGELYVQLGLPPDVGEAELDGIADGLADRAREAGAAVAGGDIVASPVLFIAVTAVGYAAAPGDLVSRAGANPGDVLLVTGALGGAAAGLLLLEDASRRSAIPPGLADTLVARQHHPPLRLEAGRILAAAGASAMIDISDGVAADAGHLAAASGVRVLIDLGEDAIAPGVAAVARATDRDCVELAAGGGEDYELLACISPERLGPALDALRPTALDPVLIGRVENGEGVVLRGPTGREASVRGFDQVRR